MTRAVIELSGDISPGMPNMSKLIEGCAYNSEMNIMGFRVKDMPVIAEAHQITVFGCKDESEAKAVIDWLKTL